MKKIAASRPSNHFQALATKAASANHAAGNPDLLAHCFELLKKMHRSSLRMDVSKTAREITVRSAGLTQLDVLLDGHPGSSFPLRVQTQVIAGARGFVGTCGGLAWLAPFLGVNTLAIYEDDRYLTAHLYAARYAYRKSGAAPFSTLNITALRDVSIALATAS